MEVVQLKFMQASSKTTKLEFWFRLLRAPFVCFESAYSSPFPPLRNRPLSPISSLTHSLSPLHNRAILYMNNVKLYIHCQQSLLTISDQILFYGFALNEKLREEFQRLKIASTAVAETITIAAKSSIKYMEDTCKWLTCSIKNKTWMDGIFWLVIKPIKTWSNGKVSSQVAKGHHLKLFVCLHKAWARIARSPLRTKLPLRLSLNCHEILSNLLPLIGNLRFTDAIFVVQSKPHLQRLYDELVDSANIYRFNRYTASEKVGRSRWLWSLFMPQSSYSPVKGLYLYGGVRTGKTMLMDLFYDQLPCNWRKKRIHFHDFMLNVHSRLQLSFVNLAVIRLLIVAALLASFSLSCYGIRAGLCNPAVLHLVLSLICV
ncbi:hypothetical protein F8388_004448 [Cannabis sativa]|uniref:Uncharacterized protein n=1 Tax=Cannabis sativa TaxID=3483 RepID=A0A7J6HCA6_CANSA|nr:hypothetical protein F8388_004448 [Cannabis sativa]